MSSGNASRYKFWTSKDVLTQKELPEKSAIIKIFKCSLSGKELKSQTDIAKKQYQKLEDTFDFDKMIKKEKTKPGNYSKLYLINNNNYRFYKYYPTFLLNQSIRYQSNFLMT